MIAPPAIVTQPIGAEVRPGGTAVLSVVATGEGLTYQWFGPGGVALADSDGEIEGAATATLRILNVQSDDAGNYQVRIRNAGGFVDSEVVMIVIGE